MSRINKSRIVLIDGNSLVQQSVNYLATAFNNVYGAGNYEYKNIAVGGQTTTDMIADVNTEVAKYLSRYRDVTLVVQEIRNEIAVNGATGTQAAQKMEDYCQAVKLLCPNVDIFVVLTSASYSPGGVLPVLSEIPTANSLLSASTSGNIDYTIDLYNYDNFSNPTAKPPFSSDSVHYENSANGRGLQSDFIANQVALIKP